MSKHNILTYLAFSISNILAINAVSAAVIPSVKEAEKFIVEAEKQLLKSNVDFARTHYVYDTYVTKDTRIILSNGWVNRNNNVVKIANEALAFDNVKLSDVNRRKMDRFKAAYTWNTPLDKNQLKQFREIQRDLWLLNAKKTDCKVEADCLTKEEINQAMSTTNSSTELHSLWQQGHENTEKSLPFYQKLISATNDNAKTLGFANALDYWHAPYQRPKGEITKELTQTWQKIKPLYSALQCHVSNKLRAEYSERVVPEQQAIPAYLLGNLSANDFSGLYDLVRIKDAEPSLTTQITSRLEKKKVDAVGIAQQAEKFYTSMGFAPLPETFYTFSQFVEAEDHKVECYPNGWVMDFKDDIRLRMCIKPTGEDFIEAHKQIGYLIGARTHNQQSFVFNEYPNEAFNIALKETITLSMTPAYLQSAKLIENKPGDNSQLNAMMKLALDKVSSLPFYLASNQWQQAAFSTEKPLDSLNDYWWQLREQYQGISRGDKNDNRVFDFGANSEAMNLEATGVKHYMSTLLQFQLHQSLCELEDNEKPLHQCSIYNSKLAGEKLKAIFSIGSSQPWPEALAKITGNERLDGSALVNYFAPLQQYLNEKNKDLSCSL